MAFQKLQQPPSLVINSFVDLNRRAGVNQNVIDICAAYLRQKLRNQEKVDFYKPTPTLNELLGDPELSDAQKSELKHFCDRQRERRIEEGVINVCIAYAGNLMKQRVCVLFDDKHLARKMKLPAPTLRFLASNQYKTTKGYRSIKIPKRDGFREIDIPRSQIKSIQRWILTNILEPIQLNEAAHGFRKGRSTITNAKPHCGQAIVIKADLKDFFPSITFSRVLGVFLHIGYSYTVALMLTQVTTFNNRLPQGAPTSPALSNIICRNLDKRIMAIAQKIGYTYTRYADDITLSTSSRDARPRQILTAVERVIVKEGFQLNHEKTSIHKSGGRQLVTGLIVNRDLAVPRVERRRLRALIHNALKSGLESQNRDGCPYFLARIQGKIAYIKGVNMRQAITLETELNKLGT